MKNTGIALGGVDPTFDYVVGLMAPKKVLLTSTQYVDYQEMREDYLNTGYLKINVEHSDDTIFGSKTVNWQFRAWHDLCHIQANAPFTTEGEAIAASLQVVQLAELYATKRISPDALVSFDAFMRWSRLIDCEVNGQGEYFQTHGYFPENQRAFTRNFMRNKYGINIDNFPKTLDGFTVQW